MSDFAQITPPPPPIRRPSPFDLAVLALVSVHLLLSLTAAAFVLHFHLRSATHTAPPCRRRLRLNALWPVRLLLLLFAVLLSASELLRPSLCSAYALSSQSFAEPAFFATLLFLLRASTHPKPSPAVSFFAASAAAVLAASPFLLVHSTFIFLAPWAFRRLDLPQDLLGPFQTSDADGHCTHPLHCTLLLGIFAAVYIPIFISACSNTVNLVINKKLRTRLYTLSAAVIAALSVQVSALAAASLWSPSSYASQGLRLVSFASVLLCASVGAGILVVQPLLDALAIAVTPEAQAVEAVDESQGKDGELDEQA